MIIRQTAKIGKIIQIKNRDSKPKKLTKNKRRRQNKRIVLIKKLIILPVLEYSPNMGLK